MEGATDFSSLHLDLLKDLGLIDFKNADRKSLKLFFSPIKFKMEKEMRNSTGKPGKPGKPGTKIYERTPAYPEDEFTQMIKKFLRKQLLSPEASEKQQQEFTFDKFMAGMGEAYQNMDLTSINL